MEIGTVIPVKIEDEVKVSYLDYAMSVIVSRALPDVRDGLKPVHRRILYAMNELGIRHNSPFRKNLSNPTHALRSSQIKKDSSKTITAIILNPGILESFLTVHCKKTSSDSNDRTLIGRQGLAQPHINLAAMRPGDPQLIQVFKGRALRLFINSSDQTQ